MPNESLLKSLSLIVPRIASIIQQLMELLKLYKVSKEENQDYHFDALHR